MFWRKKQTPPPQPTPEPISTRTNFPVGLAVRTANGVYLIKKTSKLKFASDRVFSTWGLTAVLATPEAVKHIPVGGTLGFRDGTLIKNIADGKMYLVSGNLKRHVVSPDAFSRYGLDPDRAVLVSDEEVKLHKDGEVLS